MPRPRRSDQVKRYRPSDFDLGLGSEDEEFDAKARKAREESEEDFQDDDAASSASDVKDDELDIVVSSESEPEPEELPAAPRSNPRITGIRPKKKDAPTQNTARALDVVSDYPTDPSAKWTRQYSGPLKRWTRFNDMVILLYGDRENYTKIVTDIVKTWWDFQVLPPAPLSRKHINLSANPWLDAAFAVEQQRQLRARLQAYADKQAYAQVSVAISPDEAWGSFLPILDGELTVLLGEFGAQKPYAVRRGDSIYFSEHGSPIGEQANDDGLAHGGWLLNVEGIVVSMSWAPTAGYCDQLLAMSVIPREDQDFQKDLSTAPKPANQMEGSIQIWKFPAKKDQKNNVHPARKPAVLVHSICSLWGRIAKMQWCPMPLSDDSSEALLAILSSDGKLRVVKKNVVEPLTKGFEHIHDPICTIEITSEHTVAVTCFTWVNINRIAIGCTDGSIALWSIFPCQLLQRHPIHSSTVLDIASGYPSQPSYIASLPMGGVLTVTDLSRPTAEMTYNANLTVSLQPNLLAWSEVLRGFLSMWPTNFTANSTVAFSGLTTFPQPRHIMTVESQVTCFAIGPCHPFVLIGSSDGSLWATNVLRKIMGYREKVNKIRLLKHEYRPARPSQADSEGARNHTTSQGVVRILHGYLPEGNDHPRANFTGKASDSKKNKKPQKGKKKVNDGIDDDESDVMDGEGGAMTFATGPLIVEEPLTRITSIAWNPNAEFSCWAAAAMGSGLVRVMDLGLDDGPGAQMTDSETEDAEMPDVGGVEN